MVYLTRIDPVMKQRSRSLRKEMTDAEQELWSALRGRQMQGFKFRRQYPLGNYILDFVSLEAKLVIELDGGQHQQQQDYDQQRDAWLLAQGFHVMRFWNDEVLSQFDSVREEIWRGLANIAPPSQPSP
jgi:very-short-patch-repair endonuclease